MTECARVCVFGADRLSSTSSASVGASGSCPWSCEEARAGWGPVCVQDGSTLQ